jgi:peptide/nickel transport system permease protein
MGKHPLVRYLARRILILFASFASALIALFVLLRIIPGDPSDSLIPIGATPDQIKAAKHLVGTDKPLIFQFGHWLTQITTFHFGNSLISGSPVAPEIAARLRITLPLTLIAFVIAIVIAVPIGFLAAYKGGTWYGRLLNTISQFGIAIPVFWVGLIFIYAFALKFLILPAGGFPPNGWSNFGGALKSLILPVATISFVMSASLARYIRSATLDVLQSDFLRTSRALGFSLKRSIWSHGIRNAAAPVISILGIELATTFVGAVVVETVFALPGLGSMLVKAIQENDYASVQGVLFVSTLIVMVSGFAADALQKWLDPRLNRYANEVRT